MLNVQARTILSLLMPLLALPTAVSAQLVSIQTVLVGDAGNKADGLGYGAVDYTYRIGKFEVTVAQYTVFLNAVAATDPYGLYNESMASVLNVAGIARSGSPGSYVYSVINNSGSSANRPISWVNWFDAARFVNWLHNGATNGASTETGAYTLNGATSGVGISKNPGAAWWIPSENEWYKAAYYKGGGTNSGYWLYPTKSDTPPGNTIGGATNQANYLSGSSGFAVTQSTNFSSSQNYLTDVGAFSNSASAYGTYDQGGNLFEWTDAVFDGSSRIVRGGMWYSADYEMSSGQQNAISPTLGSEYFGFRVAGAASPPIPTTNAVLTLQRTASLTNLWSTIPITGNMLTPDGKLDIGTFTNGNAFYRLRIEAIVR